jgi:hypothetical protein
VRWFDSGRGHFSIACKKSEGNRFEATFVETNVSITNRIADLGIFQLINTGTGTVEGFGAATVVLAISQDRSVEPCGAGSWTNAGTRRIVLAAGVLMLRELAYVCQTASGPIATGTWTVDGARVRACSRVHAAAAKTPSTSRPAPPRSPGS